MARLKAGVIGCGGHSQRHLQTYAEMPEMELVAVADLNPERARAAAEKFGAPHHYTDYREMLARHALDVVSLSLPPAVNRDAAVAALAAGANVLVSKPMARNLAEAKDMVTAAERAGKRLSVGLQNRL